MPQPSWLARKPTRGRKRQGELYELKAQAHFTELFPEWITSPWIYFTDDHGNRWCQPDGCVDLGDRVLLVEFKYQHTSDAWHQLRQVYQPLLEFLFHKPVHVLEVVKWYDCATHFPEHVHLVSEPTGWQGNGFGVHIWTP